MKKKRTTILDVAELAAVSRTTVSFVLNNPADGHFPEETRQRVLEAASRLNYHPNAAARRLVAGRTHVLGFVLWQNPELAVIFADHIVPQMLKGFCRAATLKGYHTLFEPIDPEGKTDSRLNLIREQHVDGIALVGPRYDDQTLLKLHEEGAPLVITGQLPNTRIPFVDVNNANGARLATDHLIHLGHERIGLITNGPLTYTASSERLEGYKQALADAGLPYNPAWVKIGNFTQQSAQAAMEALFTQSPLPTAIFVASDALALGVLRTIRQHGLRVPDDIAIVGFDDIPFAELADPPLTTIRLPAVEAGWAMGDLLIRLIETKDEIRDPYVILDTELVVRESCGQHHKQESIPITI